MKKKISMIRMTILCLLMITVILDSRTAADSVINSIELCIKTVIPGVFPFIFLGSAIAVQLSGVHIPLLEKLLHVPKATAGFFLMGLLCGYPVGAKILQEAADRNVIDQSGAKRMICFCNNASPAFIIGILASVFSSTWIAICMWMIQIISSLLLGIIMPSENTRSAASVSKPHPSLGSILTDSIKALAMICGWVILFGMILAYINKLSITGQHSVTQVILWGTLELTSGILMLNNIHSQAVRFVLSSILLSFGGLCVFLQTSSVAPDAACMNYLQARMLHALISATLSAVASLVIFPSDSDILRCIPLLLCAAIIGCVILYFNKKMVAISARM